MMSAVDLPKITVVGVGLLGGSIGLAVRQRHIARHVTGYVRRPEQIAECLAAGAVDEATQDLAAAVTDAALVILCTPVGQMRELAQQLRPHLRADAIVTDVGSVKGSVVAELETVLPQFVGSHPMAGSEKTGVAHARADLFEGAVCAVTATPKTNPAAVATVETFWRALGARPVHLSPEEHDRLVARASHLPHAVATALVNTVLGRAVNGQSDFCATGFRDTTRLADGSVAMWRDIALANRESIDQALGELADELGALRQALGRGDTQALEQFFARGQKLRADWLQRKA